MNYSRLVPIPRADEINSGLRPARHATMLRLLGRPRSWPTKYCRMLENARLLAEIRTQDVGPFRVTGHRLALESLRRVFHLVKGAKPQLFAQVGSAGMLCSRAVRGPGSSDPKRWKFSNHAWGTAIDLTFGYTDRVGDGMCQAGLLELYPYFHGEGWYWGAEFGPSREDSMHFELAEETILSWFGNPLPRNDGV